MSTFRDSEIRLQCNIQDPLWIFAQSMRDMVYFFIMPFYDENNKSIFIQNISVLTPNDLKRYAVGYIDEHSHLNNEHCNAMQSYIPKMYIQEHPSTIASLSTLELTAPLCIDFIISLLTSLLNSPYFKFALFFNLKLENQRIFLDEQIQRNMLLSGTIHRTYPEIVEQMQTIAFEPRNELISRLDNKSSIESSRIEPRNELISRLDNKSSIQFKTQALEYDSNIVKLKRGLDSKLFKCPIDSVSTVYCKPII